MKDELRFFSIGAFFLYGFRPKQEIIKEITIAQVVQLVRVVAAHGWSGGIIGNNGLDIGFFGDTLPVKEGVRRNIVLRTPVFDGETAFALLVEKRSPFG